MARASRCRRLPLLALSAGATLGLSAAVAHAASGATAGPLPPIFADDFESGDTRWWAPCLPPASAVVLLTPSSPLPPAGDPEHEIFANIKANAPGTAAVVGTFTYVPGPIAPPPPFVCALDGVDEDCRELAYDLAPLVEGWHALEIRGTRCGADPATAALGLFIDQNPPFQLQAPAVFVDAANAAAQVDLTVADAITNIEAMECLLDFDANGVNPDILAADGDPGNDGDALFVSCNAFGLAFAPTRPPGDEVNPRSPRTFSGSLTLTELAAGRHRLWYRASDFWGHAADFSVEFEMNPVAGQPGLFGHVVAIGHDFDESNADLERLLGNGGMLLTAARFFERQVRLLGLDLGAADLEGAAKANVLAALANRFLELGESGFDYAEWSGDPGAPDLGVAMRLLGRDVLLIYDQNDATLSAAIGANLSWLFALRTFVERGGVVIVLDGLVADEPSGTVRIVGNAEPWNQPSPPPGADPRDEDVNLLDSGAVEAVALPAKAELVCRSEHPLGADVGDPGVEPRWYEAASSSVLLLQDAVAHEIFVALQNGVYQPVVMDKRFPLPPDRGPVRLVAYDPEGLLRDAFSYALFSSANGQVEGVCRLRADGRATHDLATGGTVTVASANDLPGSRSVAGGGPPPLGGSLDLESVLGVEPGETIEIGRPLLPPSWIFGAIDVELPRYPDLATAASVTYHLSNGCSRAEAAQSAPGTHPVVTILDAPTTECLGPFGAMSFLAEVHDGATGEVLAYAALAGHPLGFFPDCHGVSSFSGWCVNAADWPVVSTLPDTRWASPQSPRLVIAYSGAALSPTPSLEAAQVLLRHGASSIGFGESLGINPASELYFAPKIPNAFADALRVHGLVYTALGSAFEPFSLTTRATDLALGPAGLAETTQLLPRSSFLPRILSVAVDDSSPQTPAASWTTAGSLAAALGGLGAITYAAADACEDPRCPIPGFCGLASWNGSWSFVVPGDASLATLPALPDELGCWAPIGTGSTLRSLAFVDIDLEGLALTDDNFRRSSSSLFHTTFGALRTRVESAGSETRMTSYCAEASFCGPRDAPDSPDPALRISPGCYAPLELEDLTCF